MLSGEGIGKVYPGGARALSGVSFDVAPGEVLTLLGPSGCGKSTLLRIVAGLEEPSEGALTLDGRDLSSVPAGRRDVGFVFQSYALYPHLTVRGNLSLALQVQGLAAPDLARRVGETAEMLGLEALLDRRPAQLSGGQQQRVALGRALVRRPRLLLLDEPLSNLDALLREEMRGELRALFRRLSATVIYVTHDQSEAMSLSDRVLVLDAGKARQCAPPLELYRRPADVFTATFVGSPRLSLWEGVAAEGRFLARGLSLGLPSGSPSSGALVVGVRPEDVRVSIEPEEGSHEVRVEQSEATGERVLLTLALGGEKLRAFARARPWPETAHATIIADRLHIFDAATGIRLRETDVTGG